MVLFAPTLIGFTELGDVARFENAPLAHLEVRQGEVADPDADEALAAQFRGRHFQALVAQLLAILLLAYAISLLLRSQITGIGWLPAVIAVVTNMDPEHLDHWGTEESMKEGYAQFVGNIPFYGFAVLCADHPEVQAMIPRLSDRRIVTYGFSPQADVRAEKVITEGGRVQRVHRDDGRIRLLFIGEPRAEKGYVTVVQALAGIIARTSRCDVRFVLPVMREAVRGTKRRSTPAWMVK